MSRNRNARWVIPTVAAVGLAWGYASSAQDPGTGKKVGEKVDEIIQDVKGGLRKAGDAAKEQFSKAKTAINNMGVESRVYGRLHWDKALNDASIELSSTDDGVITLDGTVADAKAKAKAVDLARDTVGVSKVVDHLAVRPASSATASP
jgi:hyperosmotically inducible periplasmic protein